MAAELKAKGYWFLINRLLRVRQEGEEHLDTVKGHISGGGSVLVITNHESFVDPGVAISLLQKSLGNLVRHKILLASSKFFPDFYHDIDASEALNHASEISGHKNDVMEKEAKLLGEIARVNDITLVPVVQGHRLGEGTFRRLNVRLNRRSLDEVSRALKLAGTIVGVSPEGTRSRNGLLAEAQSGIQSLLRDPEVAAQTMVLPLALHGTRDIHHTGDTEHNIRAGWGNVFAQVSAEFGEPFFSRDVHADSGTFGIQPKDIFMLRVARLLPREKLGYYAAPEFSNYLSR